MIGWRKYLVMRREVAGGRLCAKGTRVPVAVILDSLAEGATYDEIIKSYSSLKTAHLRAAIAYAAAPAREEELIPLSRVWIFSFGGASRLSSRAELAFFRERSRGINAERFLFSHAFSGASLRGDPSARSLRLAPCSLGRDDRQRLPRENRPSLSVKANKTRRESTRRTG